MAFLENGKSRKELKKILQLCLSIFIGILLINIFNVSFAATKTVTTEHSCHILDCIPYPIHYLCLAS